MNTIKINKIIFIAIILFVPGILIAQSGKLYTVWPVKNAGYNVGAVYGEYTSSNTSVMHDGLDIYGDKSTIVAARGGTVKYIVTKENDPDNYFDNTQGMIILQVPLVDNPDPTDITHWEYDLYMHIILDININSGDIINAGEMLGTIASVQAHLHFTRLKYYVDENTTPTLVGYDYAGKNTLNPLLNFTIDAHKDPTQAKPSLQKYNEHPSILFKQNLEGNYYRLTSDVSVDKLQTKDLPDDLEDDLMDYILNNENLTGFENKELLWQHIISQISNTKLLTFKHIILNTAESSKQVMLPYKVENGRQVIWGSIDILVAAYDNFSEDIRSHGNTVNSLSYKITGRANVPKYQLFKITDTWMNDISGYYGEDTEFLNHMLYNGELRDASIGAGYRNATHFVVTNTVGNDGNAKNISREQFWRTRSKKGANIEPNGSNAYLALSSDDAMFPDGEYRIGIVMSDLAHETTETVDIIVDNFPGFIWEINIDKKNRKKRGGNTVYFCEWQWNGRNYVKSLPALGTITPEDEIQITIQASEPLNDLNLSIPELGIKDLAFTATTNSKMEWKSGYISLSNSQLNQEYKLSFTGHDLAGNPLNYDPTQNVVRVSETAFSPALQDLPDENHSIYIGEPVVLTPKSYVVPAGSGQVVFELTNALDKNTPVTNFEVEAENGYQSYTISGSKVTVNYSEFPIGNFQQETYIKSPEGELLATFTLEQVPQSSVAFVIDRSGSMASKEKFAYYYGTSRWDEWSGYLPLAQSQTLEFIAKLQNEDKFMVTSFASSTTIREKTVEAVTVDVELRKKSKNLMMYPAAIQDIFALGGTSIGAGMDTAKTALNGEAGEKYIILLSDGMENTAPYATGMTFPGIKVIALGLGPLSDFRKLNQIANTNNIIVKRKSGNENDSLSSNGYYVYSSDSLDFMQLMHQLNTEVSKRQLIMSQSGYLNGTVVQTVDIDASQSQTLFSVSWSDAGKNLLLTLTAPDGTILKQDDASVTYNNGKTFCNYNVNFPQTGEWTLSLSGTKNEAYNLSVSAYTGLKIKCLFDSIEYSPNESIIVNTQLTEGNSPVINADMFADIYFSAANQGGNQKITKLQLFDDGLHHDHKANDGIYGNEFIQTDEVGNYTFKITATGNSINSGTFSRNITKTAVVIPEKEELTLNIPADFSSIQQAVEHAHNSGGGTIKVLEGVYNENITLYDKIWLISSGDPARTIIEGTGKSNVVTFQEVFDGGIIGFTIRGSKTNGNAAGIKCTGEQTPVIANCIITENKHGMFIAGDIKAIIGNNTFIANKADGIRIAGNSPSIMFNNIFTENQTGIETKGQAIEAHGYNNFWNNKTNYTGIQTAKGDVYANPLFTNIERKDYSLSGASPCIDAGHESLPDTDRSRSDIGAYGGLFSYWRNMFISESTVIAGNFPYYIVGRTDITLEFETRPKTKSGSTENNDTLIVNQINRHLFLKDTIKSLNKFWVISSTNLEKEKKIIINYSDEAIVQNKLDESLLKIAVYNATLNRWNILPTQVNTENNTVTTTLKDLNGYWTVLESTETEISEITETVTKNQIGLIYPNPASSIIYIPIELVENTKVSIRVFDAMGHLFETIIADKHFTKGKHEIIWNTTSIKTSGLYLVEVKIGKKIINRNIIINK